MFVAAWPNPRKLSTFDTNAAPGLMSEAAGGGSVGATATAGAVNAGAAGDSSPATRVDRSFADELFVDRLFVDHPAAGLSSEPAEMSVRVRLVDHDDDVAGGVESF
jgi:hypothetical protein